MREWYSAEELKGLGNLPINRPHVQRKAKRENWLSQARTGRGGGSEYHISNFDEATRKAIKAKFYPELVNQEQRQARIEAEIVNARVQRKKVQNVPIKIDFNLDIENPIKLTAQDKLHIITEYRTSPLKRDEFIQWLEDMGLSVSIYQLHDWMKKYQKNGIKALKDKRQSNNNKIDMSLVKATIIAHSAALHDTNLYAIFSRRAKQENAYIPTQNGFIKAKKRILDTHHDIRLLHTRGQDVLMSNISTVRRRDVRFANQEWQVDASPLDLMCMDAHYITPSDKRWEEGIRYIDYLHSQGKHIDWGEESDEIRVVFEPTRLTCIAMQDIYSGKRVWHLANTANALEDVKLLRKTLSIMGIPLIMRGDNGRDFISEQFQEALKNLGIIYHRTPPFKGKAKGAIERGFKTIMHGGLEQISGFIGHNVSDRQLIESHIVSKSERLSGVRTHLENLPTRAEAQAVLDALIGSSDEKYGWSAKWKQEKINFIDTAIIDISMGKRIARKVGREGIRIDGETFNSPQLWQWQNQTVLIADDIDDIAHKYVLNDAGDLLCEVYSEQVISMSLSEYKRVEKAQTQKVKSLVKSAKALAKEDNDRVMIELLDRAKVIGQEKVTKFKQKSKHRTQQASKTMDAKYKAQRKALALLMAKAS